jgi:hypothetical protein
VNILLALHLTSSKMTTSTNLIMRRPIVLKITELMGMATIGMTTTPTSKKKKGERRIPGRSAGSAAGPPTATVHFHLSEGNRPRARTHPVLPNSGHKNW